MKYKKGFTLVELLAVIVILAILMVSAGAGVMATMNNSKVNTFKNEILTMMEGAQNMNSELTMDTQNYNRFVKADNSPEKTATAICVTLPGLVNNGYLEKDIGNYAGVLIVEVPYDSSQPKIMAWIHNGTYGINGIEKSLINKLKFNKKNNTDSMKRSSGGNAYTADSISGGPLGVVTNLKGLKKEMIKNAYGKNDENIVGNPSDLINGDENTNPRVNVTLYEERGGSGRTYVNIPCINTKLE